MASNLTIGQCATLACFWEATIPKPGNVHRGSDFEDLRFTDFLSAAVAIAPAMDLAANRSLGTTVLEATRATGSLVATNVNLGIILLLTPLASVPRHRELETGIHDVLAQLTPADAADVYEAIRLARPGGLGTVNKMDVAGPAPANLLDAMRAAQERDLIAKQYVNGFADLFDRAVPWLFEALCNGWSLSESVIHLQLRLLGTYSDSLIVRKAGPQVGQQVQMRAQRVLDSGKPGEENYYEAIADFDFWLRSDGHRRNPGTTADIIAAALFVAFRDGKMQPPWK